MKVLIEILVVCLTVLSSGQITVFASASPSVK